MAVIGERARMQSRNPGRRPRLLVFNQYYWPGIEATARLLADLCEGLAEDYDVTVVTGLLRDIDAPPGVTSHHGVEVVRVRSSAFDRRRLFLRGLNYLTYLIQSVRTGLVQEPPDVVLCMTDPPVIANVASYVARRFGVPLVVVSQDVFPEVAVELRRLESPLLIKLLGAAVRAYLKRADRVVAIGETMAKRLEQKGARSDRLRVIPNWVNADELVPMPRDNEWAREHGLVDKFVVMHSGNVGHAQNLDALVRSATFLRDLDNLVILIIGSGARHHEIVRLARTLDAESVRFMPYQPRGRLAAVLSTGDIHFVGLAPGLAGYVVPSRLYGILSVGRPVIASADGESETSALVRSVGCGVVVPPSRPELLTAFIRQAHAGELDLTEMGHRSRSYALAEATRQVAHDRYRAVLSELVGGPR
jgi:colanic acid biosynthesis glycosyl transferase WcaI